MIKPVVVIVADLTKLIFNKTLLVIVSFKTVCFFLVQQNLYMMLLNMLAERGIDKTFCQWLLDYSTAVEQQHYVKFLEDLHGFVKLQ